MNNVLCRLCLTKCEECEFGMCITSQDGVLRNLPKMIRECILIDVTDCEPHFFSKFICNECIYRLELFYSFREQSLKNQEYYNGLLLYYQQTMPCTSKAVSATVPLHTTNVFGIESELPHEPDQPEQQNDELPDINFTMMDESEKHQLSKDYDDIIRSLQKDDLDFTANEEELVIKHELEISIQQSAERKRTETMKQEKQAQENCTLSNAHMMQTQSNVCFDPYVDIAQSIVHDPAVQTTPNEDEGLDYDDFAGIETGVSHDNEETITSEIQVESLIENAVQEENLDMMQQIVSSQSDHLTPVTTADSLRVASPETASIDRFSKPVTVLPTDSNYSPQLYRTEMDSNATTSNSIIPNTAGIADVPPELDDKTCEVCFKTFRSRQKLKIHRNTHLRVAPFKCTFDGCDKAFKSRIGLEEHLARHTNCFEYTCDICSKGFQHRSYLSAHRRAHNTERNFQCTLCEQSFKSKQALLDHKNRHLGLKPFACAQCDKQYTKSSLLQAHVKQCHSEGGDDDVVRYPCTECGKKFTSKSYLTVHKKIHRNEREFVCEVCKKGHVTRQDLLIHMTKHTGEKSLVCDICGKAYARRGAMEWHRRTHTKETPYKCDICGQTFTQATPLQVHRKLHDTPGKLEEKGQQLDSGVKVDHGR
ncbi:oocyte zinc finger protein XlCOF22-like [Anopheles ziemanni]|uniref:oocyte zinc finger protein XlCOF22-like n=1 Tax=Anopheles coustani TaxID=139045 RepID=UPI00265A72B1|nr:oocyte zinc finger protein XlCOF22-like [Anopheles coustani]XP_058169533.1 oocyte zinc finger protein XlCOF22-like [Anopheles ziemanni]